MAYSDPFRLKVFEQLNGNPRTGGADCGPSSTIIALHLASRGRFDWNDPPKVLGIKGSTAQERRANLVTFVRQLGGMATSGSTFTVDNWRAFNQTVKRPSMKDAFAELGLTKPRADYYYGADFDTTLVPALQAGKSVYITIDYQVIGDLPIKGQCVDYYLHHAMAATRYRLINGVPWITGLDPLCDGRSSSSCGGARVADGPQDWRLSLLRSATGAKYGTGKWGGYIVHESTELTEAPPEEPGTGLAAASAVGATNFKLYSVAGITAGDYLEIGPPFFERLIIAPGGVGTAGATGTGLTTTTAALYAHSQGDPVATGPVPPPTADIYDPEPYSPCEGLVAE